MGIILSIYMLIGFYSIIFAFRRLCRPGVSVQMRRLYLKKHVIYVIVYIFIELIQLLTNYYDLFNKDLLYTGSAADSQES